jgi:hypothetical protein
MEEQTKKEKEITFHNNLPVEEALNLPEYSVVIYEKHNLNEEFKEYIKLTNDAKPILKYGTMMGIHKIVTKNKVTLSISGCLGEGINWQSIKTICEKNNLEFKNQSFGSLILELKEKFNEVPRVHFNQETRDILINKCNNICKGCDSLLDKKFHIDHIRPLSNGGSNDIKNLQALCVECHKNKTLNEKANCEHFNIKDYESTFNIEAYNTINSKFFNKVVVNTILHVNAVGAYAGLASVAVFTGHGAINGGVDVGIVKHNKRCIAAQLQRHFFYRGRALRHQNSPHLRRAGKADVPHHFALAQGFANGNAARFIGRDDVEHTCWNARSHGQFARSQG